MSLPGSYEDASSSELIRRSNADPAAFAALYDRHALALRQWLFAQTHDVSVANELLSDTFVAAWRGTRRFRGENEDAGGAWLYGIARKLLANWRRRRRVETEATGTLRALARAEREASPESASIDSRAFSESVRRAFAELTPEQRRAIGYRVLGELSYQELAEHTAVSAGTARTRVHRGLLAMRAAIERGEAP